MAPLTQLALIALSVSVGFACAHDAGMPVNPLLGVPGFPDCVQPMANPIGIDDIDAAAHSLQCHQRRPERNGQLAIGCVGDSITAGVHSSGGNHTYPGQLQIILGDKAKVTNLGACGSTLLKHGDSPYWKRPQYKALTGNKWDIIIIMLGTNGG